MIAANTNSTPSLPELIEELGRLRQFGKRITQRLVKSTELMQESGVPLPVELLDELRAYRNRMCKLASVLVVDTQGCEVASNGTTGTGGSSSSMKGEISFDTLQSLLESRQRTKIAEEIRVQLSQLTHVGDPEFAPLIQCVQQAERLCELANHPTDGAEAEELEQLDHQRHPLNALLRLVDDGHGLSDLEWTECCDNVAAAYGRELATALTRGRIQRVAAAKSDVATASKSQSLAGLEITPDHSINLVPAPPVAGETSSSNAISSSSEAHVVPKVIAVVETIPKAQISTTTAIQNFEKHRSGDVVSTGENSIRPSTSPASIFDSPAKSTTTVDGPSTASSPAAYVRRVAADSAAAPTFHRNEPSAPRTEPLPVPMTTEAIESVANTVRAATAGGKLRAARISDQIIRLMAEDRLPYALQLTRCLEMRPEPSVWMPPSWLLRALVLGRHLSYSKGEITRQLDDELRNFRTDILNEGNADRQMVMGILLRAAALPAALLSGSTAATGILRAFQITPGFSQLYNYCSRIGMHGDRFSGALVEMFRPVGSIASAAELEELTSVARDWLQSAAKKSMSYSRSSPLFLHAHWTLTASTSIRYVESTQIWCKWQQTLLLAQGLLKPVCEGLGGERNWVRQEIARLTSQVRVVRNETGQRSGFSTESDGRAIVLPLEEMRATLMGAIDIANRWLRLCDQAGPGGASPIPPEALELRGEILNRSNSVIAELVQQRRIAASPLVKAAIACCQSTVRQIQSVFESKILLPDVEPDPRRVFNADLLRIPGLKLNDQWLPDNEPAVIEHELLMAQDHEELNWRQSFEFHAQEGHHDATGKLLELNVWENAAEREALRMARETQIKNARAILAVELNELAADFTLNSEAAGHSQTDRAEYLQSLDALRTELPRVLDFSAFRRRMDQLQSSMQRRRIPPSGLVVNSAGPTTDSRRAAPVETATTSEPMVMNGPSSLQESIFHSADIFSGE